MRSRDDIEFALEAVRMSERPYEGERRGVTVADLQLEVALDIRDLLEALVAAQKQTVEAVRSLRPGAAAWAVGSMP